MSRLFKPFNASAVSLGHRVVMAPLTRMRSDPSNQEPDALMRESTPSVRSEGGLIIVKDDTESHGRVMAMHGAPGIYDDAQMRAGAPLQTPCARVEQVFMQLWHVGRRSTSGHPAER